ncbi:MAG TPA: hypothetical protein VH475_13560 [Tepidisphaeraceae bacterium]
MRRRPSWLQTGIALGVIGALLVVSPALGGPSLQSLVKKEVAKQFAAAQASKKKKKKKKAAPVALNTNVVQRTGTTGPITSGAAGDGVASCVGNEKAVGGGFAAASGFGRVDGSQPELNGSGVPTGWHVFIGNDSGGTATFTVYVLCITP